MLGLVSRIWCTINDLNILETLEFPIVETDGWDVKGIVISGFVGSGVGGGDDSTI